MALRVNFNPAAILARAQLTISDRSLTSSIERLSSGLRINRGSDDPAGLALANIMRHDLSAVNEASTNAEEAINLLQTAEGAIDETSGILLRMREVALHAANEAPNDPIQLQALQAELDDLIASLDRIATGTRFGSVSLLDGSMAGNELSTAALESLEAVTTDATRLPGGVQADSTISVGPPSGDLQRESLSVTFLNGGSPAAATDPINGLTQNGTALSVSGGESLTITGPDGSATITLAAANTVGDLATIINSHTEGTGLRAAYDDSTGAFTLESVNFGYGALDVVSSVDLSGGSDIGLLDTDTTNALDNPLRPTRDTFSMFLRDTGGLIPAAGTPVAGLEGNGTLLDAVAGGTLSIFGLGESAEIDLTGATTIQGVVDAINATTDRTGAVATFNADGTGRLEIQGTRGPIFVASTDLTSGGLQVGLLDERTDLLDDTGGTRTGTSANVTSTLTYVDEGGTSRSVTLTQVPTTDGGRALVNLLPGPEMNGPYTGYESGAFRVTVADSTDGSFSSSITAATTTVTASRRSPIFFQIGPRTGDIIRSEIPDMRAAAIGHGAGLAGDDLASIADLRLEDVLTAGRAQEAIRVIDAAIDEVAATRGQLGATQANGLERTLDTLRLTSENLTASESRIRDVDFAAESARFAQFNIRLQAATSMLAQANQTPQTVLQLLQ